MGNLLEPIKRKLITNIPHMNAVWGFRNVKFLQRYWDLPKNGKYRQVHEFVV